MEGTNTLELIRQGDRQVFSSLYHHISEDCKKFIFNRGGSIQLAEEVLHESLYRFFVKVKNNPQFKIEKSVEAVVFGFIKMVWLEMSRIKQKSKVYLNLDEDDGWAKDKLTDDTYEDAFFTSDVDTSKLTGIMDQLGKDCKEVLIAFYVYKTSLAEIANELDLKKDYVKLKKFRCLGELRKKYFGE